MLDLKTKENSSLMVLMLNFTFKPLKIRFIHNLEGHYA